MISLVIPYISNFKMNTEDIQVEVFRTNVQSPDLARHLAEQLNIRIGATKVTFDLEDCDRILRVEGSGFSVHEVIMFLHERGHHIELLD